MIVLTPSVRHAMRSAIFKTLHRASALDAVITVKKPPIVVHPTGACLDGILSGPLTRRRLVSRPVGLVDVCNLGDEWVVRIWICQHRADAQQHCCMLEIIASLQLS